VLLIHLSLLPYLTRLLYNKIIGFLLYFLELLNKKDRKTQGKSSILPCILRSVTALSSLFLPRWPLMMESPSSAPLTQNNKLCACPSPYNVLRVFVRQSCISLGYRRITIKKTAKYIKHNTLCILRSITALITPQPAYQFRRCRHPCNFYTNQPEFYSCPSNSLLRDLPAVLC